MTDQAKNQVQYAYDLNNQLRSVVQTASPNPQNATAYGYDSNGNLTALEDANTHTTQNGFDPLNQLQQETLPDKQNTQTRTYDAAGNLTSLKDYNGHTTTYTYDTMNRLTQRTPWDVLTPANPTGEPAESFTYTATGKRATMTDASGTTTYGYDDHDRLATKATPQGTLSYTYDPAGNVASMQSSNLNGVWVAYTYDSMNRLATVVDNNLHLPGGQNTTTYTYDPASNLATVTYPNGLQSTITYDTLNRVTGLSNAAASYTYTLDGTVGNRTGVTERLTTLPSARTVGWSYDGIYRLTNENISADPNSKTGSVAYGLDPVGNRLTLSVSQGSNLPGIVPIQPNSITYNQDDQLSTEGYDANGNTLVSGSRTFTYDFANRLKSMTNGSTSATLIYDGDGNRVSKTVGASTTRYLVDNLNPTGWAQVVEELSNGLVSRTYTYGTQRISQIRIVNGAGTPSFYGYDGGGSVRTLTDGTGTVTDTFDYDAWGNTVNTTGSTPNVYLYRGEQEDPDLGLYYLRARYFSPVTGRFLSRDPKAGDPMDPSTLHRYLYAASDSVNRVDPSGRAGFLLFDIRAGGMVAFAPGLLMLSVGKIPHEFFTRTNPKCPQGEFFRQLMYCGPGAFGARDAKGDAEVTSTSVGLGGDVDDTPQNAFKHCYWSCRMTQMVGGATAKCIGDIHEECGTDFGSPSSNMDLHNNNIGRLLGASAKSVFPGPDQLNCRAACLDALCGGALVYITGTIPKWFCPGPTGR